MQGKTYFDRAQECRNLANKMHGDDKQKMLKIAETWIELANDAVARGLDVTIEDELPAKAH
ncbi:hypothetical protein [Rhodoplanes sp. Z2-YC6860]|uniref:hypothetical protein n=1 Tax=Rhodoplanes sp. Z2-YC6860 TaxID=674703 RepID=UPI00082E060A|nr:hypothetical protein [Rhodoplanes sp. Z2-YC6860]